MFAHSLTARLTTKLALSFQLPERQQNSRRPGQARRLFVRSLCRKHPGKVLWHRDVSPPIWHKSLLYRLYRAPQWLLGKILLPISRLAGKSLPASITYRAYKYTTARPYLLFIICGILALAALALLPFSLALKLLAAAAVLSCCIIPAGALFTCLCPAFCHQRNAASPGRTGWRVLCRTLRPERQAETLPLARRAGPCNIPAYGSPGYPWFGNT